jgi:hypothetical protein
MPHFQHQERAIQRTVRPRPKLYFQAETQSGVSEDFPHVMSQESHQQHTAHAGNPEQKIGGQFRRIDFLFVHARILPPGAIWADAQQRTGASYP